MREVSEGVRAERETATQHAEILAKVSVLAWNQHSLENLCLYLHCIYIIPRPNQSKTTKFAKVSGHTMKCTYDSLMCVYIHQSISAKLA